MPELSRELVLEATGGRAVGGEPPVSFAGVDTDTRSLQKGALFVALKGERYDGHDFVPDAFARGAGAALVSREIAAPGPLIVTEDTLAALGATAAAYRRTLGPRVVAITGSTGKTTVKEMVAAILSHGWQMARSPGNYNNEIGVPLTLLRLEAAHEAVVVELAMRGAGQIAYLAEMVQPQIGVITNIGFSHLELLGSREAIAAAKAELLDALPESGTAVLNADNEFFDYLGSRAPCPVLSFGLAGRADVRATEVRTSQAGALEFTLEGPWGHTPLSLATPGRHHALNAAAAATAAVAAGGSPEWLAPGLEAFAGAEMRGRVVSAPRGYTVIDDCYNAAPDSMRVALELLSDLPGDRKWAVLGDMKELGPMAPEWHREVGERAAAAQVAGLITVGELGGHIAAGARAGLRSDQITQAANNDAAGDAIAERAQPGDVILVKGSRAMQMEQIVRRLLEPPAATRERQGGG